MQVLVKVEDSALRRPEFGCGVRDAHSAIEGGCAPQYLPMVLSPLGAYQVFGVPLDRLTGRLVDLRDGPGADARRLGERVRDLPTLTQRFDVLDRFLLARLDPPRPCPRGAVRMAAADRNRGRRTDRSGLP
jgi:hypothetical protein